MTQQQGTGVQITATYQGSFFSRLFPKRFAKSQQDALQDMMEMSEERLAEQLRPRPSGVYLSRAQARPGKASIGNYRRSIHGELQKNIARIDDSGVVYGPWLEGTSSRNQTTRFKGYAVYRKTRDWIGRRANGILERHVLKAFKGRQ